MEPTRPDDSLVLAAAQTVPVRCDVPANVTQHLEMVDRAAAVGADLLLFPELSLTGYELHSAAELALDASDPRLTPLVAAATMHEMTIVVGAPVRLSTGLHIASLVIAPEGEVAIYTKLCLHPGEEAVFRPGTRNPLITLGHDVAAIAICADMKDPLHVARAASLGATIYLVSAFLTPDGYRADSETLCGHARQYGMSVLMANYGDSSGGIPAAGRSTFISSRGVTVEQLPECGLGLLVARHSRSLDLRASP